MQYGAVTTQVWRPALAVEDEVRRDEFPGCGGMRWPALRIRAARAPQRLASLALVSVALGGCAGPTPLGAPAIPLFDAFFPAWLLCAFGGVIGAVLVRVGFIAIGLDDILPVRLPVYVAVAVIIGLLISLFGFGR